MSDTLLYVYHSDLSHYVSDCTVQLLFPKNVNIGYHRVKQHSLMSNQISCLYHWDL